MTRALLAVAAAALLVACVPGPRMPVDGTVTQGAYNGHPGIDIGAPLGRPIIAMCRGTVVYAGYAGDCGNLVEIVHENGYRSRHCHLSGFAVRGGAVGTGQLIGWVGSTGRSTGPHLHFELYHNGILLRDALNASFPPVGGAVQQGQAWGAGLNPPLPCP